MQRVFDKILLLLHFFLLNTLFHDIVKAILRSIEIPLSCAVTDTMQYRPMSSHQKLISIMTSNIKLYFSIFQHVGFASCWAQSSKQPPSPLLVTPPQPNGNVETLKM